MSQLDHVFGFGDTFLRKLGNVAKPLEVIIKFDKRTEVCEASDLPVNDVTRLVLIRKLLPGVRF